VQEGAHCLTNNSPALDQLIASPQNRQMNRLSLLPLLGFAFVASSVQARLGENLEQCKARYGPDEVERAASVKESDPDVHKFSKDGITVVVEFRGGVAWRIVFRKPELSAVEAESLLTRNLPVGGWGPSKNFDGKDFRLSADKLRIAVYAPTKATGEISSLTIATRDYGAASYSAYAAKVDEALRKAQERKTGGRLEGF
jgi:hypothetical protein